jgi:hypothetical protein
LGEADEIEDETVQERFCRFFNREFGSAYLTAPATGQETFDDINDELYDMAGGNLERSNNGVQHHDDHLAQSNDDVNNIYGNSANDGIITLSSGHRLLYLHSEPQSPPALPMKRRC